MPDTFHVYEIAERYCLSRTNVYKRIKSAGLTGTFFTAEEAYRIGSFNGKLDVGHMYRTTDNIPSKLNFTRVQYLPDWPK